MTDFLPKDYKAPEGSSDFFKPQPGDNKIRVLTKPIIGWEGWQDGKPFRRKGIEKNIEDNEVEINKLSKKPAISPVWAMLIWDYEEGKVKVWNLTQKTIMAKIVTMNADKGWGDVRGYDIGVERIEGKRTSYDVRPYPHKKLDKDVLKVINATELDAENSFRELEDEDDAKANKKANKKFDDF